MKAKNPATKSDLFVLLKSHLDWISNRHDGAEARLFKRAMNRYAVTSSGHIYSLVDRHGVRAQPRAVRPGISRDGYLQVILKADKSAIHLKVHRLVAEVFLGLDPKSPKQVHHKDFDRTNNRLSNLELVTAKENMAYNVRAGRTARKGDVLEWLSGL